MQCGRFIPSAMTRGEMLSRCANGFGAVALMALMGDEAYGGDVKAVAAAGSLAGPMAAKATHFAPKCRNVIFLYMDGGPAQMDTFDPKPLLSREHGQQFKMKMEPTQFNNNGATLGSP